MVSWNIIKSFKFPIFYLFFINFVETTISKISAKVAKWLFGKKMLLDQSKGKYLVPPPFPRSAGHTYGWSGLAGSFNFLSNFEIVRSNT